MKIFISEAYNFASDGILRVIHNETNYEVYLLSSFTSTAYENKRIHLFTGDILDVKNLKKLLYEIKPDVIINTLDAGDYYSNDREYISKYNVQAVENLCSVCRVLDCHIISISNDKIFNGLTGPYSEDGRPDPKTYYGTSKHAMENTCRTGVDKCTIVRTSDLYGVSTYGNHSFSSDLLLTLMKNKHYQIPLNYYTNPCFLEDFAYSVLKIIEKKYYGIFNTSGPDYISLHDHAIRLAMEYSLDPDLININKTTGKLKLGLINYKAESTLGIKFSSINSGIMSMKHFVFGESLLPPL